MAGASRVGGRVGQSAAAHLWLKQAAAPLPHHVLRESERASEPPRGPQPLSLDLPSSLWGMAPHSSCIPPPAVAQQRPGTAACVRVIRGYDTGASLRVVCVCVIRM